LTTATVVATPPSTLADGARRPIAIAVSNIRDALGNTVPDGTRIALTADPWYRRDDGGWNNESVGGTFLDGVATPNDGRFKTYTVQNGRVDATYSAETIAPLAVTNPRSSVIAVLVASPLNNNRLTDRPFAEGVVATSGVATATAVTNPTSLVADRQDRVSVVTVSGLTDAQGRVVPDGTKVAITAQPWYRLADGGWNNNSAGGTMTGGDPTPNDGRFRTYQVTGGQVTFSFTAPSTANVTSVISAISADGANNRNHHIPFATVAVRAQ
jgi:hypothetical protein